ncbi:MAG: hypothetical protein GX311_08000 [Bacteroidales bacterium]|jgi:DNA-binding response OmpR family regulator|nr:hypothetical protein [Bacteroidales bacterium]
MQEKNTILVIDQEYSVGNIILDLVRIRYRNVRAVCSNDTVQIEKILTDEPLCLIFIDHKIAKQSKNSITQTLINNNRNNVPIILLSTKNSAKNTSAVTIADTIDKPFKPATLFLIIDKYVDNINSDGIASKEFTTPVWADFEHIDLKIMFETYSNEREKVIKILKLFPESINPQFAKIDTLIRKRRAALLIQEFMSIRSSFLYFAKPDTISSIDKIIGHLENNHMENVSAEYQNLLKFWSNISAEIDELIL